MGSEDLKHVLVIQGKMFPQMCLAAEALGIEYVTLRMSKHFWGKGERGGKPPWFLEMPVADECTQEIVDSAKEETFWAAKKLYDLHYRVIQEAYDKDMAGLNKKFSIFLEVQDELNDKDS